MHALAPLSSALLLFACLQAPAAEAQTSCGGPTCANGLLQDLGALPGWGDRSPDDHDHEGTVPTLTPTEAARQSVLQKTKAHEEARRRTGIGTHYGDKSPFYALPDAERQAWLDAHVKPGADPVSAADLTRSSCIEWTMEHVRAWYEAAGDLATWERIDRYVRDHQLQGTALAQALHDAGWRTVYLNPDTSWRGPDGKDEEHHYSWLVAKEGGRYYEVPVDETLVDWEKDPARLDRVRNQPFFVFVARGGLHVVAGVDGQVNELARGEGPDSTVIYQDPFDRIIDVYARTVYGGGEQGDARARHMWGSGVMLLPPTTPK